MKKIILIVAILATVLFANKIILETGANVREEPNPNAKVIDTVSKGKILKYTESVASYYYVEITGKSSHVRKKGWMWAGRVDPKKGLVTGKGVVLRNSPEYDDNGTPMDPTDDDNFMNKVRAGATVKILKTEISWFKVWNGWISAFCVLGDN